VKRRNSFGALRLSDPEDRGHEFVYAELEMMVLGFIGLSVLLSLFGLAKGARRFNVGPRWLRQFALDKHTLY